MKPRQATSYHQFLVHNYAGVLRVWCLPMVVFHVLTAALQQGAGTNSIGVFRRMSCFPVSHQLSWGTRLLQPLQTPRSDTVGFNFDRPSCSCTLSISLWPLFWGGKQLNRCKAKATSQLCVHSQLRPCDMSSPHVDAPPSPHTCPCSCAASSSSSDVYKWHFTST
eukprot:scaffold42214_cov20-Tisochrysis_lutea.AAC.1